jgi:hypothetical protein
LQKQQSAAQPVNTNSHAFTFPKRLQPQSIDGIANAIFHGDMKARGIAAASAEIQRLLNGAHSTDSVSPGLCPGKPGRSPGLKEIPNPPHPQPGSGRYHFNNMPQKHFSSPVPLALIRFNSGLQSVVLKIARLHW